MDSNAILILVISALVTAATVGIVKFWGKALNSGIKTVIRAYLLVGSNNQGRSPTDISLAESEYRATVTATIDALKERISLLEKWKLEALELEKRVNELEETGKLLAKLGQDKDTEALKINAELEITKKELAIKLEAIKELEKSLDVAQKLVLSLKSEIEENKAKTLDNNLKIEALIHQAKNNE